MYRSRFRKLLAVIVIICYSSSSFSHSGRTDSNGCHNDNIHGGYHCHNGGGGNDSDASLSRLLGGLVIGFLILYIFKKIDENKNQKSYMYQYDYNKEKSLASDYNIEDNSKNKEPNSNLFSCDIKKSCHELSSCDEAKFYFKTCVGSNISNFCEASWCVGENP